MSSVSTVPALPESQLALVIRPMDAPADFLQAEQVQQAAWGFSDRDMVPAALFAVARNFGGQAFGAFEGAKMVGFALSFGAVERGHAHFHSHMVAIVPGYQNRGLGRLIKLAQREDALSRGIDRIAWTYDPLQVRNAHFNISRLGAVGVRYLPDLYGVTSSHLHGGMPTDRLLMEWNLSSARVVSALAGQPAASETDTAVCVELPRFGPDTPLSERLSGQLRLKKALMDLLDSNYVITGFRSETGTYILEKH